MIRSGKESDLDRIVEMSGEFWAESPFDDPFEPEHVRIMAALCIETDMLAVYEKDGVVFGFCCGIAGPLLGSSGVMIGTEVAWWIDPEHRSGRAGMGLLKAMEERAKAAGCKYWAMMYMHTSMPEQIESIYRKLGYKQAETSWTRVL